MQPKLCAVVLASLAATARGGDCSGNAGWINGAPTEVAIGSSFSFCIQGPANQPALFLVSGGQGPIQSKKYGEICLDFPVYFDFVVPLDASGTYCFDIDVECDPTIIGLTLYSQFVTCKPIIGISNQVATTVVDGINAGDLCTYPQDTWGQNCSNNNVGCLLETWFPTLFPNGLLIGDADGVFDGDGVFAARWDSAATLNKFLPIGGGPGPLTYDAIDPKTVPACEIAGHLVAAKLNCAFDDAGVFDDGKCRDDLKLCDLIFVSGVDVKLIGWTVRDVIELADQAISGALGAGPFDVDGDGVPDLGFGQLNTALKVLNANFEDCDTNNGILGLP